MLRIRNDEIETRTEILTRFPLKIETEPTDLPTLEVDSTKTLSGALSEYISYEIG